MERKLLVLKMKSAIVLSAHNTRLAVIRSLGEAGIPIVSLYYDKNDMGYVSKYVKKKTPYTASGERC